MKMPNLKESLSDEFNSFMAFRHIWVYLANQDIKSRFRRSKLGVLWLVVHQLAFTFGAGLIWAAVFGLKSVDFIPFLAIGFSVWVIVAGAMLEGCNTFVISHGYIKQIPLPQSIFIFRTLLTQIYLMSIGIATALSVLLFFGKFSILSLVYSIPGILIVVAYAYGAIGVMAYLGLRYRDLPHGLAGIFNLLFVITPVIYPSEVLIKKGLHFAVYLNPFTSLIDVIRTPLLHGILAEGINYFVSILCVFILIIFRFVLAARWKRYVPYWS
jgi:ABC-type polysaccharide/polyol phosphate export permease